MSAHDIQTLALRPAAGRCRAAMGAASPALCLAAVGAVFVAAYWLSNHLTSRRHDIGAGVFAWERGIPFVPWTIVPYLSIVGFFVLSFFVCRDRHELRRHVAQLLLALGIAIVCYAVCPLRFTFERPATVGMTGLLFEALGSFDLPYNRAPSLHICVLLLLWVRLLPHTTGGWRLALHGWFMLIGLSVLTTYQHHVIDVPAGFAVGMLCLMLTSQRPVSVSLRAVTLGQSLCRRQFSGIVDAWRLRREHALRNSLQRRSPVPPLRPFQ